MEYVALTFWLLVIILTATGVHRLLSGLVTRKVLNAMLIPGTLVAHVAHAVGLLITGARVGEASLYGDDGGSGASSGLKTRIPLLGPVILAAMPLAACVFGIILATGTLGRSILGAVTQRTVQAALPVTMTGVWQLLRDLVTLAESFTSALRQIDLSHWMNWIYLYLLTCLVVQLAPFQGTLRGALAAVVLFAAGLAGATALFKLGDPLSPGVWALLNLTVATLLLLLLLTLLIHGIRGLFQTLRPGQ